MFLFCVKPIFSNQGIFICTGYLWYSGWTESSIPTIYIHVAEIRMFHVEHLLLRLVSYTQKHFSKVIFYVGPDDSVWPHPWYSGWTESSIPTRDIHVTEIKMFHVEHLLLRSISYSPKHFPKTIFYVGPDYSVWPHPWIKRMDRVVHPYERHTCYRN